MNQDFELKEDDVLELSRQEGVVSFFAKLGYDTNKVVEITPQALGMREQHETAAITPLKAILSL